MFTTFNTSEEIAGSSVDTAVLPMGSVEPKGPHLPVGLDLILANRFARDFCTGKAVYLLPVFPFSTAMETRGFRGTIALQQQTLWDVINDIASVLARHGFKRLLVLDFSNYNWILKHAVRELNLNRELIQAIWVNPKEFARVAVEKEHLPDYGGGAVETSLALALDEKLVRMPLRDFDAGLPRETIDYDGLAAVAPDGFWGKPESASAGLGKRLYRLMLEKTDEYVRNAVGLFQEGASIGPHETDEIWWPQGEIPGVQGNGLDWHSTLSGIAGPDPGLVIIPTAATEQHSPSQPLATDHLTALELSRRLADVLGAYLLPALPIVTSWGHIRFRGTLTLGAMTVRRIIEDIAESLYAGGFRKAAIVNTHGGNWVVKPTLIEINQKRRDFKLIATGDILAYRGQAPVEQLHACESESSFIKAFYPDSFKADRVIDYSPMCSASAFDLVGIGGVSPRGVWGYPSRGTAEKGRAEMEKKVADAASYIRKVFNQP
jgi:creatinine amidohydrolase